MLGVPCAPGCHQICAEWPDPTLTSAAPMTQSTSAHWAACASAAGRSCDAQYVSAGSAGSPAGALSAGWGRLQVLSPAVAQVVFSV